jgi:hypothetical protein
MNKRMKNRTAFAFVVALIFCVIFSPISSSADSALGQQKAGSRAEISGKETESVAAFEKRAGEYARLREQIEEKMAKLPKESTPEQIHAHKTAFEERVRAARVNAKPGEIFTPDIAAHIRTTIKTQFKGKARQELRETVLEADTKGVPLRVNYPYPETKELVEMPPTLLLKLPRLPKQLRYRFVGRNMLLVDRENSLIVDYMLDALP